MLTGLSTNTILVLQEIQTLLQNIAFIFADVLTARDIAIRKLNNNNSSSISSGVGEKLVSFDNNYETNLSVNGNTKSQRNDWSCNIPRPYKV
jgi:hypothetical protein